MADVSWIKLYTDMFTHSRKIKKIENMDNGDTYLVIWIKLLLLAGVVNDGGAIYVTRSVAYDIEDLAYELRKHEEIVEAALSIFESFDMIERDNGYIYISSWEEYQNEDKLAEMREKDRERKRKAREKAREKRIVRGMSEDSPQTDCEESTDCPHIEEDEEKDKEKESHSFIQSSREEAKMRYLGGTLGKGVVMLSDEQVDTLLEICSIEEFDKYVGIVADMELSGKHYKKKTHFQAILDMVKHDRGTNG